MGMERREASSSAVNLKKRRNQNHKDVKIRCNRMEKKVEGTPFLHDKERPMDPTAT